MDSRHSGQRGPSSDKRAARGGMWAMWFCLGVGILVLLSFFFWR